MFKMFQAYDKYTEADHWVWQQLFDRQMEALPEAACVEYMTGIEHLGFNRQMIPDFKKVNARLSDLTGWEIVAVPGSIGHEDFFKLLANRQFPATTWIRKPEELDYLEEPDMFHDVFGHIPLLSHPEFTAFLERISKLFLWKAHSPQAMEILSRVFWYTVEFGMIQGTKGLQIYGAGLLSSAGETQFCLSEKATHLPFQLGTVLQTDYIKEEFQAQYFVIDSFEELYGLIEQFPGIKLAA